MMLTENSRHILKSWGIKKVSLILRGTSARTDREIKSETKQKSAKAI